MGFPRLPVLAAALILSCEFGGPPPSASATHPATPSAAPARPTPLAHRSAAQAILEDGDVGLPRVAGRDHIALTQAAEEQQNQPLALMRYRSWGWLDQATRTWSAAGRRLEEDLLVLTRVEGARLAYGAAALSTGSTTPCADEVRVDECTATGDAGAGELIARLGQYHFHLKGVGVDVRTLGRAQAARLRQP